MLPNLLKAVDFVTVTEEVLNGKLHFLCSAAFTLLHSFH